MKANFANYALSDRQQEIIERIEKEGFEFQKSEINWVSGENDFNTVVEQTLQHLKDLHDENIRSIETLHYETRTEGPYKPYPASINKEN